MDKALVEKAKTAKTAADLRDMAAEEGYDFTPEQAKECYAKLHNKEHELSEAELANVSGGACGDTVEDLRKKYQEVNKPDTCSSYKRSYWAFGYSSGVDYDCCHCHWCTSSGDHYFGEVRPVL